MAGIRIHREHEAGTKEAKRKVKRIAKGIADRFEVSTEWDGDVLFFKRTGVNGRIVVDPDQILVEADISFLLLPIRGAIESEIRRYMEEEFGQV